jgi:hypothetical protein
MVEIVGTVSAWDYRSPEQVAAYEAKRAAEREKFELERPRYEAFLRELSELTLKHGVEVYSLGDYYDGFSLRATDGWGAYEDVGGFLDIAWLELLPGEEGGDRDKACGGCGARDWYWTGLTPDDFYVPNYLHELAALGYKGPYGSCY